VVAVVFQNVFYLEMHQNNFFLFLKNYFWYQPIKIIWKHQKYINLKQRKKIKFLKNTFETQKQIKFYEIQLKKHVKTSSQKLRFKLNFLIDPAIQNTVWFDTKYLVVFVPLQT
jgi:hypothetical protein